MNCERLLLDSISEQAKDPGVSTLIRDAIVEVGSITFEDALALEESNLNTFDDLGYTPLHWVAARGTPSQIDLLLQHGAHMHLQDPYCTRTPFLSSVIADNAPCVEFFLSRGSNIEDRDLYGAGALHLCRSPSVMQILLSRLQDTRFLAAKSTLGETALHSAVDKPLASELLTRLVQAGAELKAASEMGLTPLLLAVLRDLVQVTKQLHNLGARFDSVDEGGKGVLHYAAVETNVEMMSLLRSLALEGIDPEQKDFDSWSVVDSFKARMDEPWRPGETRPTQRDVFSFYALITEIRDRNWERGLFLETRERLEREGQLRNIRRWLGRQWQKLHDDEEFGDLIWDIDYDYYPEEYYEKEIDIDYDVGILFGDNTEISGDFDTGITPILLEEQHGDMDEFFDALEE